MQRLQIIINRHRRGTRSTASLNNNSEAVPFIAAICLFLVSYLGIAISLWSMIVPYTYTLWDAASAQSTQAFLMVGALFLLPVILMYTGWSYWVFRGKVRTDIGYIDGLEIRFSSPLTFVSYQRHLWQTLA